MYLSGYFSFFCGEVKTSELDQNTAIFPTVIIEILYPTIRNYDRSVKFMLYRAIPSLTNYILIDSESIRGEHFSLNKEEIWQLKELNKIL
jgi:Uma2 family endonuclease